MTYLDTHIAVWLSSGQVSRLSAAARKHLPTANLLLSPIVLLDLEYLFEIKRIGIRASEVFLKLQHELGVEMCALDFQQVISMALNESWTRDAFDRIIVAHAKANGLAYLISADEKIRANYPRTIW